MSKKQKDKCIFNENWLVDSRFKSWLKRSENKWTAYCEFCKKIDISNMGISALTSHLSGQKHSEIASLRKSQTGALFFRKEPQSEAAESRSAQVTKVEDLVIHAITIRAEILWTLKVVTSHFSLRSCLGLNELFEIMFPVSKVATSVVISSRMDLRLT